MNMVELQIWIYFIVFVVSVVGILNVIQRLFNKKHKKDLDILEREKNVIASCPISNELSKVETLIKNDGFNNRLDNWQNRYIVIKEKRVPKLNDMILDADFAIDQLDYRDAVKKIAQIEMEVYKVRNSVDSLLDEIKEITLCEERNRNVITKFKAQYRDLVTKFRNTIKAYGDVAPSIEIQFENIGKLFSTFEEIMERHEYEEVGTVVKAIDESLAHMAIVVEEVPSVMLMLTTILPSKVKNVIIRYEEMINLQFPLEYMQVEYNMNEINKKAISILTNVKMLNIGDSIFELKIIIDYLDSLFIDFEKEKKSKKIYEDCLSRFDSKMKRIHVIFEHLHKKIKEVEESYSLKEEDKTKIVSLEKDINVLDTDYKILLEYSKNNKLAFSKMQFEIEKLNVRLKEYEYILEEFLEKLASMFTDEDRARDELIEIKDVLFKVKEKVRGYKLPLIDNIYFVQLKEGNAAIREIVKELENKPMNIEVLNIRVDTARDLILKLYNTTNEIVKTAMLAELSIVYGNRYRSDESLIDKGLNNAEVLFNHGEYKRALETSISSIKIIEPNIHDKLLKVYAEEVA